MASHPDCGATHLPTRRLGTPDMAITRVGLGAWAIGGTEWSTAGRALDDEVSIAAIRRAIERGINWIDTAPIYGRGHSEEVVRRALEGIPKSERPFVFTKCGIVWDERDRNAPPQWIGAPASLRRELDDSLRRLGVERIDLYQMHRPAQDGTPLEEYWQALLDFKKAGKVRAVGLSNHSVEQLDQAERIGHVQSLQPPFSAIRRRSAAEIAWCLAHETGVIVYSPMQAGLLTGAFTPERARSLPKEDWRAQHPEFVGDALLRNLALAEALQPIAARHETTLSAVAVAWTLAWRAVTGAIVGARAASQVDGWMDAATLELTQEDLQEIAAAIERTGAGSGPSFPVR
ncbi:MAG TPA: aldo/keto reductase [Steroidobacteraceae bacterium]|nr:aldo/keto reductase [Steroidobacteraceae bacterium]